MHVTDPKISVSRDNLGQDMYQLMCELYPICRSITGNGFRETLRLIDKHVPLVIHEVPTGTQVFDWTVPKEWNIRDAYVKNSSGERIIDFKKSNLHVVGYSVPVRKRMSLRELRRHLFTLSAHPDWIPYRTSYYREDWGFCLSHNRLLEMEEEREYEVVIDSSLENGHLTYGEYFVKGKESDEVLISTHACHPSLCNDNLSGVVITTFLAKYLTGGSLRYSYRFLFLPGTIGSITWLCLNEKNLARIKHGLVAACLGDSGAFTYKKSRQGDTEIDKAVINILRNSRNAYEIVDFFPYGYDERQYCSPAFNLPVGVLSRTPHGRFPEYHTSADDVDFVQPEYLADSLSKFLSVFHVLESNKKYLNQNPKCEPQLGRRGLYGTVGGEAGARVNELALLWVLNFSDGQHSLLDISDRSALGFDLIKNAADVLLEHGLLRACPTE